MKNKITKFLILAISFFIYFLYLAHKQGAVNGSLATLLTWSFLVLCSPIPDGGFLIDFPLNLITNIKMVYLEIFPWLIAISINIYAYFYKSQIYKSNKILKLLKEIISRPNPYWSIIIISCIGTFLSLHLADKIVDKVKNHKQINKTKNFITLITVVITIIMYTVLLKDLHIH